MRKNIWLVGGVVIFFIVLSTDLFTDLRIGDKVNHQRGALLRFIGLIPCILCFVRYKKATFVSALFTLAMVGFNYMNLFDGFYNVFRGYNWFFTGSEDGAGDAMSDNFFQSIPLWAIISIKLVGSVASIFLYYKNKQKW